MLKELSQMMSLIRTLPQQMGQIQEKMGSFQAEAQQRRATGRGAAGRVQVEMNGLFMVLCCEIDPALSAAGGDSLSNGVVEAMNDAVNQIQQASAGSMSQLAEGLDMGKLQQMMGGLGMGK